MLALRNVGLKNSWSGRGVRGKILKTKKAGEAISGHFSGAILPSVNEEFQRMLLPFILYALLNKDLENYAYICIRLLRVQISLFRFDNLRHLHLKISTFHKLTLFI